MVPHRQLSERLDRGAASKLVLDDYHVIDAREVQDGMAFLLDHLPAESVRLSSKAGSGCACLHISWFWMSVSCHS